MVTMKSSHQNTQQGTVQLAYMDTRLEGKVTVKMMMIQERMSKTTVPISKMFIV